MKQNKFITIIALLTIAFCLFTVPVLLAEEAKKEEAASAVSEQKEPQVQKEKASEINKISYDIFEKGIKITIAGNGEVSNYNSFALTNPSRLVVDIWDVAGGKLAPVTDVKSTLIKKIRVGKYADKVRVAFDSKDKSLPKYEITKKDNELIIVFGGISETASEKSTETKEVKEARETKASKLAVVTGIDYRVLSDKSRFTLSTTKEPEYTVEKDAKGRLVLRIKNAVITRKYERALNTKEFKAGVDLIRAKSDRTKGKRDVLIDISYAENIAKEVSKKDFGLVIDFTLPEGYKAEKEAKIVEVLKEETASKDKEEEKLDTAANAGKEGKEKKYTGQKLSLDFQDADIRHVIKLISEISNFNFVVAEEVKNKVTIKLINVPWDQALDVILENNGLGMVQKGNIIKVATLERLRKDEEAQLTALKAKEKLEPLAIKIIPVNYGKAADLQNQIKGVLSDRGKVNVDSRTNSLVVTDIEKSIAQVEDFVKKLDSPTPQVLIEARIIQANTSFSKELGFQWGGIFAYLGSKTALNTQGGLGGQSFLTSVDTFFNRNSSLTIPTVGSGSSTAVNLPASGPSSAFGLTVAKMVGGWPVLLDFRLTAMQQEGKLKIISSPRITTLDNVKAEIKQGAEIPYSTSSSAGTNIQFKEANLELSVTPHITPDNSIFVEVEAKKDSPDFGHAISGNPPINTNRAKTQLLLKDGETAVIGGIYIKDTSETQDSVPGLSKIPILGYLFKHNAKIDNTTELMIFLTTTIIKPAS